MLVLLVISVIAVSDTVVHIFVNILLCFKYDTVPLAQEENLRGQVGCMFYIGLSCYQAHTHMHVRMRMCARKQPFYGSLDFVQDYPGEPVPVVTFTHSHLS